MDSGYNQTTVFQWKALESAQLLKMWSAHVDFHEYLLVLVNIKFRGEKRGIVVAVTPPFFIH